ncbi:MAG: hypothetical protein CM15mP126_4530 [Gammaproteobacteria bacterium]|nr:MAG: hypothetical protein CM15mP126_4530 [Gammaproteobacteria bacterium]
MITDPLFILGFIGMTICLFAWIKFNLASHQTEPFVLKVHFIYKLNFRISNFNEYFLQLRRSWNCFAIWVYSFIFDYDFWLLS